MQDIEKLGVFYLGRKLDREGRPSAEEPLLYESRHLTTHAVCLGMTGSGKTGLCLSLIEEAAIDGIPVIAVDPKGDLGNLLLAFPGLAPSEFRPWVDEGEAARRGISVDDLAAETAARWGKGLADWGQDGARVARYRDAVDLCIYTPGSRAGTPLSLLRSLAAPPRAVVDDPEALGERVASAVGGLLGLLGVDSDPMQGRETILLSNLVAHAWSAGRDLDLAALIQLVQRPPFERVGVLDLESFYPAKERFGLAMTINNLLASPGFAAWLEGDPLDIGRLLYTPAGKPRVSILSIAHLGDAQRMFFVTTLLGELLGWMRAQSGTSSLRALFYMDEIFGYFPPSATPPSKKPMLTLLKQARAFGLGVMLATQNPVDLDYKGLANAGTWFIGRLQTERDRLRVLDGLEGAAAAGGRAFDRGALDALLGGLGSRVFLLSDVHAGAPALFQTRWSLSFLRGPLSREQIQALTQARRDAAATPRAAAPATASNPWAVAAPSAAASSNPWAAALAPARAATPPVADGAPRPLLPPDVVERFVALRPGARPAGPLTYRPALLAVARLHFAAARPPVDAWQDLRLLADAPAEGGAVEWSRAVAAPADLTVVAAPEPGLAFSSLPGPTARKASYATWQRSLATHLYQERTLRLWRCPTLSLTSTPGEDEGAFRGRLALGLREQRDAAVDQIRKRSASKVGGLETKIRKAEARLGRERSQLGQRQLDTTLSVGTTLLGALFGGKIASVGNVRRAATAVSRARRTASEKQDVAGAEHELACLRDEAAALASAIEAEVAEVQARFDPATLALEPLDLRPRKGDITAEVTLAWIPCAVAPDGTFRPIL